MRPIKFYVMLPQSDFAKTRALAELADAVGFYGVGLGDHLFVHRESTSTTPAVPFLECYTMLGAIAAATKRVKLTQVVTAVSFRNPALLAKMTSTLDHISGGRFELGIGAGWLREEYEAYDYPYPSNAERIEQMAEAIRLIKAMWTQDEPRFHGRYFKIEKAYNYPKPVQKPHPPILVGGSGKKVLQVLAREGDIANLAPPVTSGHIDPEKWRKFDKAAVRRKVDLLRQYTREAGRDPDEIEIGASSSVFVSRERGEAERAALRMAKRMGFLDDDTPRRVPGLMWGTPEELRNEVRSRIEDLAITHFPLYFMSTEAIELFAREVMPAFTNQ